MVRRLQPPSQTWRTFLDNHTTQIVAADFFVVPTATCRVLFVLVMLAHDRRRVVHLAVTAHPTAGWTAQQLREAFPWDRVPRYLLRDRDRAFAALDATARAMSIQQVLTAPQSPWQNAFAERFIGSVRRECLDTSLCSTKRDWHDSSSCIATTTNDRGLTCRSAKTHRSRVPSWRRSVNPS
jgi:putative transposase